MSDLPPGWDWATIGSVADSLVDGPFGSNLKTEHYQSNGIRVIRLQNIADGRFNDMDKAYISEEHAKSLSRHDARPGDVLIAAMGDVLPRVCLVPRSIDRAIVKADCFRLRPLEGVLPQYLAYMLSAPQTRKEASTQIAGVGRPRLNLKKVSGLTIPIPPEREQAQVVAAVDEQFSRLDAGFTALDRVRRNLRRMRASVRDAAVTGRLVPRNGNPAEAARLVAQLCDEAGIGGKRKAVVPDIKNLTSVPDSWQTVSLSDLAESIDYGTSEKSSSETGGLPVLRMGNLGRGTITYESLKFLPHRKVDSRLLLQPGDLLFNRTNSAELVGKTALFHGYREDITFASYLIRVRPLPSANLEWASIVLNSAIGRRYVAGVRTQQVGQANVNGTKLAAAPIPLPSAEEQSRIAAECERLFSIIDSLEHMAIAALKRGEKIRSSILSAAFTGNFVLRNEEIAV